jgi:1-aminocyclopropane-1-carboxylate deaminase
LEEAKQKGFDTILSFGGAYSNHLHALAYAGKQEGFKTIGIIRGEEVNNPTLHDCKTWGMQLEFISRSEYQNKNDELFLKELSIKHPCAYIVPEGGSNELGIKGCEEILSAINYETYSHIACSVGTGTTLCGIVKSVYLDQEVLGFSAIKNGQYLEKEIQDKTNASNFTLLHDYHFGGFGKKNEILTEFMQEFQQQQNMELDRVYTAKMMFGIFKEIELGNIKSGSKVLAIHTGGLQGNRPF